MNIKFFGLKLNVEILILMGVLYLILVGNTVCSSSDLSGVQEYFTNGGNGGNVVDKKKKKIEGFVGTNFDSPKNNDLTRVYSENNVSSWDSPNLTVKQGQPLSKGVSDILNRPSQPIPLPKGELLLFANTNFKPECCPNTYSTSTGCACMTTDQYNYLVTRGGNNVPYSEY